MKKNLFKLVISLIFVVTTVVCLSVLMLTDASALTAASGYAGGNGNSDNPYQIATPAQWAYFANQINAGTNANKYFVLTADITFNSGTASSSGMTGTVDNITSFIVGSESKPFMGVFDGQGHTISGAYIKKTSGDCVGLFGAVGNTVKNLVITNSYIYSKGGWVGAAVGECYNTTSAAITIQNIYVTQSVYVTSPSNVVGGVIGGCAGSPGTTTVSGCAHFGNASGMNFIGGIIGSGNGKGLTINSCLNGGYATGGDNTKANGYHTGGIVAAASGATVNYCVNLKSGLASGGYYNYGIGSSTDGSNKIKINYSIFQYNSTDPGRNVTKSNVVNFSDENFTQARETTLHSKLTNGAWTVMNFGEVFLPTGVASFVAPISPWATYSSTSSFTISSVDNFKQLSNFVATGRGDFSGKTVNLSANLTFNNGTASSWVSSFSGTDTTPFMVGSSSKPFKGTFNGNGKTISGVYMSTSHEDGTGLFGFAQGATIQNFVITNSCFKTSQRKVAAVVGELASSSANAVIENIYVTDSVYVVAHHGNRAGIVSTLNDGVSGAGSFIIRNCVNAATISVTDTTTVNNQNYVGGILANANSRVVAISNCLNLSEIRGHRYAAGIAGSVGSSSASGITINYCVNLGALAQIGSSQTSKGVAQGALIYQIAASGTNNAVTLSNCRAGSTSYANDNVQGLGTCQNITWEGFAAGNFLSTNKGSALTGGWTELATGGTFCDTYYVDTREVCFPSSLVTALGGANNVPHSPLWNKAADWIVTGYAAGLIGIDNEVNFIEVARFLRNGYSDQCLDGGAGISVVLNVDLDFNSDVSASSMLSSAPTNVLNADRIFGTTSYPFKGTFNGDGHTISGAYVSTSHGDGTGLFGFIDGATIQNLIITNSCFKTSQNKVAALVGELKGASTIENIYVTDSVYVQSQRTNRAGIVSTLNDASSGGTIRNCVNAANISVVSANGSDRRWVGGIVGNGNSAVVYIYDCLNLSDLNGDNYTGGIAGSINNTSATIDRCVNLGTISENNADYDYSGDISNSGGGQSVLYRNCFGVGSQAIGREPAADGASYTQISADAFMTKGFLTGTALSSTWVERAGTDAVFCGEDISNGTREVCIPKGISDNLTAPSVHNGKAPVWLKTQYDAGTITIDSLAHYGEFVKFVNGDYSDSCADGAAGKVVQLTTDLTFNTGTSSSWTSSSGPANNLTNYMICNGDTPFAGEFDGQGHKFSGAYISLSTDSFEGTGIFSYVSGNVHDIVVDNSYIYTSFHTVGGLIGIIEAPAQVSNIYTTKSVYVTAYGGKPNGNVGGIIGAVDSNSADGLTISGCFNAATVKAQGNSTASYRQFVGGIIGNTNGAGLTVSSCMNAGSVTGEYFVAGIIGCANTGLTLSNCLNIGTIYGDTQLGDADCYADIWCGNVTSGRTVSISNCYGLNSKVVLNRQSSDTAGTVTLSNVGQSIITKFFGSPAATSINGFTERANDVMVPTGVSTYVGGDKIFTLMTLNGASVRINNTPYGIRFEAVVNKNGFTEGTVTAGNYGFLYAPTEYVTAAGGVFTEAALTAYASSHGLSKAYVKVPSQVTVTTAGDGRNGYYHFALAVTVAEKNFDRDFSVRAYVEFEGKTYYSDYMTVNNSRSVSTVARLALQDVVKESNVDGYSNQIETVYSCYSNDQRTALQKYVSTEVRTMYLEMTDYGNYTNGIEKAVQEIYKYDPDVISVVGASGITFANLTGYTTSEASSNAAIRVLYKTSRFTAGSAGDIDVDNNSSDADLRYVELYDKTTTKTSIYAAVDRNLTGTHTSYIKSQIGNASKGLIITGYFGKSGDNSAVIGDYLTSAHAAAPVQYYVNYLSRHKAEQLAIMAGSVYKSAYAEAKRFRISEEKDYEFSSHYAIICDYKLK